MSATVRGDSPENSARAKSPFVPLPNSAPAKMAANVLITLLITLVSVCPDLLASIVPTTSMIALTTCAKMAALVSTVSTNTLAVVHPSTAVNSAKLNPGWPKCTSKLRLAHNTIVSMESVSNRLEVTTTFANVPQDTQVLMFKKSIIYTQRWIKLNSFLCILGKRCEYLTSLSFLHNTSYVELEPLNVRPHANVTITFATEQENGVLLYSGDSQHLAVELFRGRLRVSYDVGNYPVSTMFSYELIADGEYHTVEILAIKKNFTLRVDGGLARSIVNEGPNEFLNARSPFYIAGVPDETGSKAWKQWHLRNTTSFIGNVRRPLAAIYYY